MGLLEAKTLTAAVSPSSKDQGGNPLLRPDPGMVLWTWVVFVALLLLMTKFAWKPILRALKSREKTIEDSLQKAEDIERNLQQSNAKQEALLREAMKEASLIVEQAKSSAQVVAQSIHEKATSDAEELLQRTEASIEQQKQRALRELREQTVGMALQITSTLLDRNITDETNKKLAERAMNEVSEPVRGREVD